jgi:hypothetical protein
MGARRRRPLATSAIATADVSVDRIRRRIADSSLPPEDSEHNDRYHRPMAEQHEQPLSEQLEEIGSRLAWVRDYL